MKQRFRRGTAAHLNVYTVVGGGLRRPRRGLAKQAASEAVPGPLADRFARRGPAGLSTQTLVAGR
ncbi:hypothetical protein AB0M86_24675 [Streptomyces sp. NPDC051639]|uniref:hypothetical protein n=1 Tax=Streptomyces sp. NPDC051639 TaxID=3155671 RepID=UPI00344940A2